LNNTNPNLNIGEIVGPHATVMGHDLTNFKGIKIK